MSLTEDKIKQIVQEELEQALDEAPFDVFTKAGRERRAARKAGSKAQRDAKLNIRKKATARNLADAYGEKLKELIRNINTNAVKAYRDGAAEAGELQRQFLNQSDKLGLDRGDVRDMLTSFKALGDQIDQVIATRGPAKKPVDMTDAAKEVPEETPEDKAVYAAPAGASDSSVLQRFAENQKLK